MFFHAGGDYSYINFDDGLISNVAAISEIMHYGWVLPTPGNHDIDAGNVGASWSMLTVLALQGAHPTNPILQATSATASGSASLNATSMAGGMLCEQYWVSEHTHDYAWTSGETQVGIWHETDEWPWPTMASGYQSADALPAVVTTASMTAPGGGDCILYSISIRPAQGGHQVIWIG
jgi:hypothetical protein